MMDNVVCLTQYFAQFLGLRLGLLALMFRMTFSTLSGTENCWFFLNPRPVKHLFTPSQPTKPFVLGHFIFWPDEHYGVFFGEILVKCIMSGSSGGWLPHVTRGDGCQVRHQAAASEAQGTPMRWENTPMVPNSCKFESELSGNSSMMAPGQGPSEKWACGLGPITLCFNHTLYFPLCASHHSCWFSFWKSSPEGVYQANLKEKVYLAVSRGKRMDTHRNKYFL